MLELHRPTLLLLMSMPIFIKSFDVKCEFKNTYDYGHVPGIRCCYTKNMNVQNIGEQITSINGRSSSYTDVEGFVARDQVVRYVPKRINVYFPRLKLLIIYNAQLISLTKSDLQPFPGLVNFGAEINNLKKLSGNLFDSNPKLRDIDLARNKLEQVGKDLLSGLSDLQDAYFHFNTCIDMTGNKMDNTLPTLIHQLRTSCPSADDKNNEYKQYKNDPSQSQGQTYQSCRENVATSSFTQRRSSETIQKLNNKIATLEAENSNCMEESKSSKTKINFLNFKLAKLETEKENELITNDAAKKNATAAFLSLQKENSMLSTCDESFDAITKILFEKARVNDHVEVFVLPEPLHLIVETDGSIITAFQWKIFAPQSRVKNIKDKNGASSNATQLIIDHQQTLFLPTNLGQVLESLKVLEVKSSNLIEIDSSVFNSLYKLTVLKLCGNKLRTIPLNTFENLKNLEVLDLSSNYLESLKTDVFSGLEKMKYLNLAFNQLKSVSSRLLENFKNLVTADLSNNVCINMKYPKNTLKEIESQIFENCSTPVEVVCFTGPDDNGDFEIHDVDFNCDVVNLEINHPKTKISKISNPMDANSKTFSIIHQQMTYFPLHLYKTFTYLRSILVDQSQLKALLKHNFEGLQHLEVITLINNNISLIEIGVFDDVPQLKRLDLAHNNIQSLPPRLFIKLDQLEALNLAFNELTTISSELLPPNNSVKEFLIQNNKLDVVDKKILRVLRHARIINFLSNVCINMEFTKGQDIGPLSNEIIVKCLDD